MVIVEFYVDIERRGVVKNLWCEYNRANAFFQYELKVHKNGRNLDIKFFHFYWNTNLDRNFYRLKVMPRINVETDVARISCRICQANIFDTLMLRHSSHNHLMTYSCKFSVGKWKRNRRVISPAFNPTFLFHYFLQMFNEQNVNLIGRLKKEVGTGKHFDLWPHVIQTSITTICGKYRRKKFQS